MLYSVTHSKLFHVRAVTQGDVIRAEARDIPRIFQLLYAGEGENRRKMIEDASENPLEVQSYPLTPPPPPKPLPILYLKSPDKTL